MATDPSSSSQNIPPNPFSASTVPLTSSLPVSDRLVVLNIPISTKLTRSNFLTWRCQIEPALHGHGLYRFLTDDPPPRSLLTAGVPATNPAFLSWYQQDQLLLTWHRSSLSEPILNQTVSCSTSTQLWHLLQQSFSATSRARRTELRRALQTTTKGGSTCLEFCQRMRAIADELAFIGSPVSDDDLVIQILTGLGSDFNSFVAAANAKDHLDFAELQAMLLSYESLLLSQIGGAGSAHFSLSSDPVPAALYSQSKPNSRYTRSGRCQRSRGGYNPPNQTQLPPLLPNPSPRPTHSGPQYGPTGAGRLITPNNSAVTRSAPTVKPNKDTVC